MARTLRPVPLGPPGRVLAHEVVPGAVRAHLDLVAEHWLGPAAQGPFNSAKVPGQRPPGGELGAEDKGHGDQAAVVADGADLPGWSPDVAGGPQQLGVGVAHVDLQRRPRSTSRTTPLRTSRYSTWAETSGLTAREDDLGSEVADTASGYPPRTD